MPALNEAPQKRRARLRLVRRRPDTSSPARSSPATSSPALLDRAAALKAGRGERAGAEALAGRSIALFFEFPSTRTRVSFGVGVAELGAQPVLLRADELQLGRGETIADTARVLSGYLHGIVIRSGSHETLAELAERRGDPGDQRAHPAPSPVSGARRPADVARALRRARWAHGRLRRRRQQRRPLARDRRPDRRGRGAGGDPAGLRARAGFGGARHRRSARGRRRRRRALHRRLGEHGRERDAERKRADLGPYQLNEELLGLAAERAIALHCLPAHPGEEISAGALYGPRSAVWDQAENRLHAQKALLELLIQRRREPKARTPGRP